MRAIAKVLSIYVASLVTSPENSAMLIYVKQSPAGDVLSINVISGDTGFAGHMESALSYLCFR